MLNIFKAKEQELECYDDLLKGGSSSVTHDKLVTWMNEHQSLASDFKLAKKVNDDC